MTTDLLPCPFCGGQPEFWNAREDVLLCTCLAGPGVHGSSKENAIAIWNRRADLSPSSEVVKELVEALELADAALSGADIDMKHVWRKIKSALANAKLEGGE